MKRIILAALVGVLVSGPSLGDSFELLRNMDCSDQTGRDDIRNKLISIVQSYTEMIEKVPPEETNYLQSEIMAVMESANEARWDLVTRRPYYHAYKVHKAAKIVIDDLNPNLPLYRIQKFGTMSAIDLMKLQTKVAIESIVKFSEFKEEFFNYVDFDGRRRKSVLSKEIRERIHFKLQVQQSFFVNFSKCLIDAIN